MIELDGAAGEGGGQILRSSLTLAMITGRPFRIRQIRARRAKPGLMRQHLVAVQAASQICGAEVNGATVGSQELEFVPGPIRGGDYRFAIGTAGSCTLVLQTVLPALLTADRPSTLHLSGGTHNPMAPPVQFLQRAFCRLLAEMGAQVDVHLERFGFYPAGGGEVVATVRPCAQLQPRSWMERGERKAAYAECFIAGIPPRVAQRELECVGKAMNWGEEQLLARRLPDNQGPGNALMLTLEYAHTTEVFTAFGEKSVTAENVARQAVQRARKYLCTKAAVSEYLGDQLMLPLALAGGGGFTVDEVSMHARTNAEVIERFLPVRFEFGNMEGVDAITVHAR
ncbi:RNA 3'-terminal phosphate cyclase [Massilia norwichensis]|uniref:RNA 3'-terminal phosphate cyclase n=1 Tax=Massilia norwichensis TaxID=1442366 RepID=A0ABT2A900_9BURK|nr:RNA 3'-terminal phosphate cyclase [Massilia norwichensis]MCS0590690.1 RNA 3'-terminal phosphate cyclase [Massilia norwichensis]